MQTWTLAGGRVPYIARSLCYGRYVMFGFYRWYDDKAVGLGEEMDLHSDIWGSHTLCHADQDQSQGQQHIRQRLTR